MSTATQLSRSASDDLLGTGGTLLEGSSTGVGLVHPCIVVPGNSAAHTVLSYSSDPGEGDSEDNDNASGVIRSNNNNNSSSSAGSSLGKHVPEPLLPFGPCQRLLMSSPVPFPTVTWRSTPDWTEKSQLGEHLWTDTNVSGDLCVVSETDCCKGGSKKKCTACKIVVHTTCMPKLKFFCRNTYREASVREYRDETKDKLALLHHWVHRKRQEGKCKQCGKSFQTKFPFNSKEITAIQCSWCKSAYHNKSACFTGTLLSEQCSLGTHAGIIVPPSWIIKLSRKIGFQSSVRRPRPLYLPASDTATSHRLLHQSTVDTAPSNASTSSSTTSLVSNLPFVIKPIPSSQLKPVVVFLNPRSGGNQGSRLMHKFQWLLNPRQVFDLSEGGPRIGLEMFGRVPNVRILACGGDGTAGWILSEIDALGINPCPPLAVLPLGTGNDLSRTLGWGAGYTDEPLSKLLCCVEDGRVVNLDRWNLITRRLTPPTSANAAGGNNNWSPGGDSGTPYVTPLGTPLTPGTPADDPFSVPATAPILSSEGSQQTAAPASPSHQQHGTAVNHLPLDVFNNYFSLGADAATALEFHESREANPEKFNSRLKNKIFYAGMGGKDLVKRTWRDLSDFITLECDGEDMTQRIREVKPHVILFLNIPRYSAGTLPWGSPPSSSGFGPQRMDDGCLEVIGLSSASLAALQVGGHGDRLCQCRAVVMTTHKTIPMQVDGEPCRLRPSHIEIILRNQGALIQKPKRRTSLAYLADEDSGGAMSGGDPDRLGARLRLSLFAIPLVDYEENVDEKNRVRSAARFSGMITVDGEANLSQVRTLISSVPREVVAMGPGNSPAFLSDKWVFLDFTTANHYFRVDRDKESVHFVMDICSDDIYLIDPDLPSSIHPPKLAEQNQEDPAVTTMQDFSANSSEVVPAARSECRSAGGPNCVGDGAIVFQLDESLTVIPRPRNGEIINHPRESQQQQQQPINGGDSAVPPVSVDLPRAEAANDQQADNTSRLTVGGKGTDSSSEQSTTMSPSPSFDSILAVEGGRERSKHLRQVGDRGKPSPPSRRADRKKTTVIRAYVNKAYLTACKEPSLPVQDGVDRVRSYLAEGADPCAVDSAGWSALHYAAKFGHVEIVDFLVNNVPREILELRDFEKGQTALHKAAAYRRRSVCSLLLSAGASLLAVDSQGRSPRQLALLANDRQLAQFLQSRTCSWVHAHVHGPPVLTRSHSADN